MTERARRRLGLEEQLAVIERRQSLYVVRAPRDRVMGLRGWLHVVGYIAALAIGIVIGVLGR